MYSIRFDSPDLVFTASHGIRYDDGWLEPLHEHKFRVIATLSGPLNKLGYVIDFHEVTRKLKDILLSWDNAVLFAQTEKESRKTDLENVWVLPIHNTTAELIASQIASQLSKSLTDNSVKITIELEESPGFWGIYSTV